MTLDQPIQRKESALSERDLKEYTTERETTIVWSPGDPVVHIYSSHAPHIAAFRKDDAYTEVQTWPAEPEKNIFEAASFEIRRDLWIPTRGRKRPRVMSDEQRAEVAARFKRARSV